MNKKPGFQIKIGGETILYIVIGILIFGFVLFMPDIYKFISRLKTGNIGGNNNTSILENNKQDDNTENDKKQENEIISDSTLVCTKMESEPEGNLVETYIFYYNNNNLEALENEKSYDAIADEYLNYVYSEQAKFNKINNSYKEVLGFSYESTLENRMLVATFSYDLTKLNVELLRNEDEELNIELNVSKGQTLDEVENLYLNLGYDCR